MVRKRRSKINKYSDLTYRIFNFLSFTLHSIAKNRELKSKPNIVLTKESSIIGKVIRLWKDQKGTRLPLPLISIRSGSAPV